MLSFLIRRPGHISLFCGDTVFHGGRILLSDIYDCDVPAYARTLRRLAALEVDSLFPADTMWTVRGARAHLRKAAEPLERPLLPPNWFDHDQHRYLRNRQYRQGPPGEPALGLRGCRIRSRGR